MSGSTKAGFAAKRQSAWREGGREGAKTRKRESGDRGKTPKRVARRIAWVGQSGDRGKTPKRVPRQFAWPCIAAFCAFGENETEGRTSSLKSRDAAKTPWARRRGGGKGEDQGNQARRAIAVLPSTMIFFAISFFLLGYGFS